MKKDDLILHLKNGIGGLLFNTPIDNAIEILGKPNDVEDIGEDIEYPTTILHYDELGLSLFYENNECSKLVCIDIDNEDAKLFGEKIIGRESQKIVELMVKNGIYNQNMEEEEWGEKRISFENFSVDFYFIEDKLVSVTYGK